MPARILHVSDLHCGRRDAPDAWAALVELAAGLGPELVVATGDLAHRGRRDELARAAERLSVLGLPVLAVPGNHDLPYTPLARFTRTYGAWDAVFGSSEPVYSSERVLVAGASSASPWRRQGGALPRARLERLVELLVQAAPEALRVVALHHHLAAPPWRARRKRPLARRNRVLRTLAEAGAELVLSGHVHQAGVVERREFEVLAEPSRPSVVLATAPGFERPRPRRRGEAQGLNVYEASEDALVATTYAWTGSELVQVARRTFSRAPTGTGP